MKAQIGRQSAEARGATPQELAEVMRAEIAKSGKVVIASGAKAD